MGTLGPGMIMRREQEVWVGMFCFSMWELVIGVCSICETSVELYSHEMSTFIYRYGNRYTLYFYKEIFLKYKYRTLQKCVKLVFESFLFFQIFPACTF